MDTTEKQKMVIIHPGQLIEPRKTRLKNSGHPTFTATTISTRYGSDIKITLPSDPHIFFEIFDNEMKVNELRFVLVGNSKVPDLSEYASTVKTVRFSGHIFCTTTALEIVLQLTNCANVQFFLGQENQLPLWLPYTKTQKLIPSKSVKDLYFKMDDNMQNNEELKQVFDKQLKGFLSGCAELFPEVTKFSADLHATGLYYDQLKNALTKFKNLNSSNHSHVPEIRGNKLVVVHNKVNKMHAETMHVPVSPVVQETHSDNESNAQLEDKQTKRPASKRNSSTSEKTLCHSNHDQTRKSSSVQKSNECIPAKQESNTTDTDVMPSETNKHNDSPNTSKRGVSQGSQNNFKYRGKWANDNRYDDKDKNRSGNNTSPFRASRGDRHRPNLNCIQDTHWGKHNENGYDRRYDQQFGGPSTHHSPFRGRRRTRGCRPFYRKNP